MRQFKPGQLQTGSLYNISASYAVTASYASNGGGTNIDTGSLVTTASFNAFTASYNSGSFTGSFVGNLVGTATTASYALYAVSASYEINYETSSSYAETASIAINALTASYVNPLNQDVQLTGSLYLSTPGVASIYFTGSGSPGQLTWNDTDGTLDLGLKGGNVTLQIGQEQVIRVVNKTGANLLESEYTVARIRRVDEGGAQGQRLAIVLAQANNDANSVDTLGIVTENIDNNQEGFITNSGLVRGINTTGTLQGETWVDGDVLYLSPTTPGALTTTKPQAPNHTVIMGYVVYAHSNQGKIFVKVDNGYEIDELHNVRITTSSLSEGQLLVRSGSNSSGVWINTRSLTGSYSLTGSLIATSFTGSLFGTATSASYVLNAVSSSFATSASNVPIIIGSTTLTSGTSGRLLFQSGSVIQQDSEIFWDTTNKKLGIGKSPAASSAKTVIAITDGTANTNHYLTLRNLAAGFGSWGVVKLDSNDLGITYQTDVDAPNLGTSLRFYYGGNSAFASSLSVGSLTTPSARLDVRAQGALSTDTAFRVRNSGDTANILTVNGDGTQTWFAPGNNALNSIKSGTYNLIQWGNENFGNVAIGYVTGSSNLFTPTKYYNTLIGASTVIDSLTGGAVRVGALGSTAGLSAINIGYSGRVSGSNAIKIGVGVGASNFGGTNSIHIGSTTSGNEIIPDNVFMTYFNSQSPSTLARSNGSFGLLGQQSSILSNGTGLYGVDTHMGNGGNTLVVATHPSPPSSSITTAFQLYASTGSLTSNIRPHFRTSNGTIVWFGDESRLFNVTASAITASSVTASLQGTASYATMALSASYAPTIIPSGSFGIANSSGSYTYYTNFSASMAAASSGQTVEMFADVTETGSVTVTLKNRVNINGNGHTYTLNVTGTSNALTIANSTSYSSSILNINVVRTGSTSDISDGCCMLIGTNVICDIDCQGSQFINLGSGVGICVNNNTTGNISNAIARSKSGFGAYFIGTSVEIFALNRCIGYGYSGGTGIRLHNGGTANHCIGISDSGTGYLSIGNDNNCVGISSTGTGFNSIGGRSCNCTGRSISSTGYLATSDAKDNLNCVGISVSGTGISAAFPINNCAGVSSSGPGLTLTVNGQSVYNTYAKSSTSYAVFGMGTTKLYGCTIISEWNNAAGYGIRGNGGAISDTIVNCIIRLSNASAPYLFNDGVAQAISMRGNTYQGGAAFNANLTQAIVATEDNQGNIYL